MIGFRLTVLEAQRIAVLHAALPPDACEIAELEAFLPVLARRGFTRAVLDLSAAPPMDAAEAAMLREASRRLADSSPRACPSRLTEPCVGSSTPPIRLSSVLLPLPLGPCKNRLFPALTVAFASSRQNASADRQRKARFVMAMAGGFIFTS